MNRIPFLLLIRCAEPGPARLHPCVERRRSTSTGRARYFQAEQPAPSSRRPAWKGTRSLAIISPSKSHITFAFERGAEFDDAHGLLDGSGKRTRHVKIRSLDELNADALRDYIAQAVRLDGA
jgi:hypothetical protein